MRGIVLEIRGDRCVVLKKDGSFEEARNRNYTVGQEIGLHKPAYVRYLSAAACLILVCAAIFGYSLYNTPVSFVYLDINPSIRLDINRFERVIDVVPLNDDAQELLSHAAISRHSTRDCMDDIVSACMEQHYLNELNTDIEVSVRTDDAKLRSAVETASAAIGDGELEVSVFRMDEAENDSAMEHHISARRLRAVRAYTETFGGTLEENLKALQGVSSDEINDAVREYRRTVHSQSEPAAQAEDGAGASVFNDEQEKKQPSADREVSRSHYPSNDDSGGRSADGSRLRAQRLAAIRAYTERFGGTPEENAVLLRGVSSADIYRMISQAGAGSGGSGSP